MNKIIKIFILYCLPILTIQSCGKQCNPKPADPENQQPTSSITEAMCKKTKDYLQGNMNASAVAFFEQTMQEIRNGNPAAVNEKDSRNHNFTVLHYAICSDNEELFNELLKLSPDLTQKNAHGETILIIAIGARKVKFVNMILAQPKLETFINEPILNGNTPLTCAKLLKSTFSNCQEEDDLEAIIQALQAKSAV